MGQVSATLSQHQRRILDQVAADSLLAENFYFTGGSALSEVYLHHRESIDLDFFCKHPFDVQSVQAQLTRISHRLNFSLQSEYIDPVYRCTLTFADKTSVKVDFGYYPYEKLRQSGTTVGQMTVDSLLDIAANKLVSTTQRSEVKDFVDLFFLLKQFTVWDLISAVELKFKREIDPLILASDLVVVDDFKFLPRMIKPLTLDQLKRFFRQIALDLGRSAVER